MAFRPRDLADRMAARRRTDDGFLRETFSLPVAEARIAARNFFSRFPRAAYMSEVESWRELPDGQYRIHHAAAAQRRLADPRRNQIRLQPSIIVNFS